MSGIVINKDKTRNKDLMEELKSEFNEVVRLVILEQIFVEVQENLESGALSHLFVRAIEKIGAYYDSFPRQFLIMIRDDCERLLSQIPSHRSEIPKLVYRSVDINLYDELNIENIKGLDILNVYRNDELFQNLSEKVLGNIFTLAKRMND